MIDFSKATCISPNNFESCKDARQNQYEATREPESRKQPCEDESMVKPGL